MMEGSITIWGEAVRFRVVDEETAACMGVRCIPITVKDPTDGAAIRAALQDEVLRRFWYIDPGIRVETLRQVFEIILGQETTVAVYNFLPCDLTLTEVSRIGLALQDFRARLQKPEHWQLQSIQIRSRDQTNTTNGLAQLGYAYPRQHRLELFPESFVAADYRGVWPCSTLRAIVQHETSHVCLDDEMRTIWMQHLEQLGWEMTEPGLFLRLPGGYETRFYRRDWQQAVTPYAGLLPDEDRAECAPCLMNVPERLDPLRRELLEKHIFLPAPKRLQAPDMRMLRTELPRIPQPLLVWATQPGMFVPRGITGEDVEIRTVLLEDYRRQQVA